MCRTPPEDDGPRFYVLPPLAASPPTASSTNKVALMSSIILAQAEQHEEMAETLMKYKDKHIAETVMCDGFWDVELPKIYKSVGRMLDAQYEEAATALASPVSAAESIPSASSAAPSPAPAPVTKITLPASASAAIGWLQLCACSASSG